MQNARGRQLPGGVPNDFPDLLVGPRLRLRAATIGDAPFILSLRLDPRKSRHLASTAASLAAQIAWMEDAARDPRQLYFIVEGREGHALGTLRMVNDGDGFFSVHSWILKDDVPWGSAAEIASIVFRFALSGGWRGARFATRRDNVSVWRFFERLGAVRAEDGPLDFSYQIPAHAMRRFLERPRDSSKRPDAAAARPGG